MRLSVGEVARLSGVTIRTLHHYDEVGLLSPSERSVAGYRLYSDADVDRLQQILFYRELGFSLAKVKAILDDPATDAVGHLGKQHALLLERAERLHAMAKAVERAMEAQQMGAEMTPEEKLGIFGSYGLADLVDPSVGQQFADALNAGDLDAAASLVADDATWHVEGDGPPAGEYRGPGEVLKLLRQMSEAGLIGRVNDVCVSDVHVVLMGAGGRAGAVNGSRTLRETSSARRTSRCSVGLTKLRRVRSLAMEAVAKSVLLDNSRRSGGRMVPLVG